MFVRKKKLSLQGVSNRWTGIWNETVNVPRSQALPERELYTHVSPHGQVQALPERELYMHVSPHGQVQFLVPEWRSLGTKLTGNWCNWRCSI